ncbi:MAG: AI-2E family transporter [Gammaproteobacteria bacterium]|nr:AI-2E family transporter [Gammaproteobacteria bacterium]
MPIRVFKTWIQRYFSDPQAVYLLVFLVVGFSLILTIGHLLAPALAATILAYLLEPVLVQFKRLKIPRLAGVILVFTLFLGVTVFLVFAVFPVVGHQLNQFFRELPNIIDSTKEFLNALFDRFSEYLPKEQVTEITASIEERLVLLSHQIFSATLESLPGLVILSVYLVIVPLLLFFFLKDKDKILEWCDRFFPKDRHLAKKVWEEVDHQLGNFIKGKALQFLIIGTISYIVFAFLDLHYSALLGFLVGLSVFIPYIGGIGATIPIALVAFFQWGFSPDFWYAILAYILIQGFDGNVLVPILFSGVVSLHPVAIIMAVIIFGGLLGFWGIFFAIPLAILVKAILNAWPKDETA